MKNLYKKTFSKPQMRLSLIRQIFLDAPTWVFLARLVLPAIKFVSARWFIGIMSVTSRM